MRVRLAAETFLLLLLLVSPGVLAADRPVQAVSPSGGPNSFVDHGIELMNSADRITLAWLNRQTGNDLSVHGFERAIQSSLLSFGVRKVLLDIGWQDSTLGNIPRLDWVDNWLSASDTLGVQNLLFLGQLSQEGYRSTWTQQLIAADPASRTYFSNGTAAPFISVDNPDVTKAIELDLQSIYAYYGTHPSWVGLGSGYPRTDPYYPASSSSSSLPIMGYSNASIQSFVNSPYFARDTNQTGFFRNGTAGDLLWASYKHVEPSVLLSSGIWVTSSPAQLSGSTVGGNRVVMKFAIPKNESVIQLRWYGDKLGNAGDLVAQLFPDKGGAFVVGNPLANASQPSANISGTAGWQGPVRFTGSFPAGNYWVLFSSPSSNSATYLEMYLGNYRIGNYVAYSLQGSNRGSGYTTLWVKDGRGADLELYPFLNAIIPTEVTQSFTASHDFQFNTVFLFLSDRHYDETKGTLTVTDTAGNAVVAQGTLDQTLIHGLQNWTPIQLDRPVSAARGHTYVLSLSEPNNGYSWRVVMRGLTASPARAGFQSQASFWLFRLALASWGQPHVDFSLVTSNGADAVRRGHPDAIRFSASSDESLRSIAIMMKNLDAGPSNHTSGSLTVGLWTSGSDSLHPSQVITSKTFPGSQVPENGWLNYTGLNREVKGGSYYWIVLSTDSNETFSLARLTSPYESLVEVSGDGGKTWHVPSEGPSAYSYHIVLSRESLGNNVYDIPKLQLTETGRFAEPFQVATFTQVKGIYLGEFDRQSSRTPNDHLAVSINPDDGKGEPSQTQIASGIFYGDNITFFSSEFVQFTSTARLNPGQRYWIVVQPVGGSYYIYPVIYGTRVKNSSEPTAMITDNNGFTWSRYSNQTLRLSYILASPHQPNPTYDTQALFRDMQKFHNFPADTLPLRGWNAYIQASEMSIITEVASWLHQYTGRNWEFAVSTQPAVLQENGSTGITPLPVDNPFATCADVQQYLLATAPVTDVQLYDVGNMRLFNDCKSLQITRFAQLLSQIQFFPPNGHSPVNRTGGKTSVSNGLVYSITGASGGPMVVWISNPTKSSKEFSLSLSSASLGFGNRWALLDLTNLEIQAETGHTIIIIRSVPAQSWEPLVIVPYEANFLIHYSTATIQRQLLYPNQGLYAIGGSKNQSILFLTETNASVGYVMVDAKRNLTSSPTAALYGSREAWHYDNRSGMLLVKFISTGDDTLRVHTVSPPPVKPRILPTTTIIDALVALVAIDVVITVYFRFLAARIRASRRGGGRT